MYRKFIDIYSRYIKKIKSKINSNKDFKNRYEEIKGKLIGSKKILQTSFYKAQDSIEKSFKSFVFDESLLKQSSFWIKSVTWSLLGTSTFVIVWLSFAKTDEVVFAIG